MKNTIKHVVIALALISTAFAITACNTTRGFGQDLEKVGDEIEDAANK